MVFVKTILIFVFQGIKNHFLSYCGLTHVAEHHPVIVCTDDVTTFLYFDIPITNGDSIVQIKKTYSIKFI